MSFIITTLFIISCVILIANCGDYYKIDGRTYYTSYPDHKNWDGAILACAANGTLLVDVPTADEHVRLLSVINQTETKHNLGSVAWWTSGSDQKSENTFIWETTGNPVEYTYWRYGEPNNHNGVKHCIAYYKVDERGLSEYNCKTTYYFICRSKQVELPVVVPVPEVETVVPVTVPNCNSGVQRINRITGTISVICVSLYIVNLLW